MFMGIVSAAGATPLPDPSSSALAPAAGDDQQFDAALTANLQGGQPAHAGAVARAEEGPSRLFADPLALAEWLLIGTPAQTDEAAAAATSTAETSEDDQATPSAKVDGDALWEIPVDGLLAIPPAVPEVTLPTVSVAGEVVAATSTLNAPMSDASAANTTATSKSAARPQAALSQSMETPAASDGNQPAVNATDATTPAQAAPAEANAAAQANALPTDKNSSADKSAAKVNNGAVTTTVESRRVRAQARSTHEGTKAAEPQPAPSKTEEVAPKAADASAEASVAENAPVAGKAAAKANAPQTPQAKAAVVQQTAVPASTTTKADTTVVSAVLSTPEQDLRETSAPAVRQHAFTPVVQQLEPQMNGGSDTPAFGEADGRRSAAAARLAAALSMGGSTEKADGASAPAFTMPAAPAPAAAVASAAPVVPTAPMTGASMTPDAENITKLVEAMRVTAKSGGWEATVRLKPHHLGEVSIALRVEGNTVSAVVNAEAAGVRQWLQSQEDAVRSGMAEHGLHLERFQVTRDGQRRDAQQQEQEPQRRRQPRRSTVGAKERFEIVV